MMNTEICSSVEGAKVLIECRQFIPRPPQINAKYKGHTFKKTYPFKIGIFGKVTIEEEVNPKLSVVSEKSLLCKDDEIQGESIEGFSTKPVRARIEHLTSSHKGTQVLTSNFTYAHIQLSMRYLLQKKAAQDTSKLPSK